MQLRVAAFLPKKQNEVKLAEKVYKRTPLNKVPLYLHLYV